MTAYQDGGFQKKMFDVSHLNIKCKSCGIDIKELPFMPREDRLDNIFCSECNAKRPRRSFGGGGGGFGGGGGSFQKKMFDVSQMNIKCKDCGTSVAELPFMPKPDRTNTILCRECLRKNKSF